MRKFEYIFFDCMETIVDLHKLPAMSDYAAWAYEGSGVEELWKDFDEFFRYFVLSRQELKSRLPEYAEFDMAQRFLHLVGSSLPELPYEMVESVAAKLCSNYWRNYKAGSYVRDDVRTVIAELAVNNKMGVVSNFMVNNGIEELLEMHDMRKYFNFVVTSIAEGWRKPHSAIYSKALELAGVTPERVIFVGDDFINDFDEPGRIGMKPVYLDRYDRHPELSSRVRDFYELSDRVKELL